MGQTVSFSNDGGDNKWDEYFTITTLVETNSAKTVIGGFVVNGNPQLYRVPPDDVKKRAAFIEETEDTL